MVYSPCNVTAEGPAAYGTIAERMQAGPFDEQMRRADKDFEIDGRK